MNKTERDAAEGALEDDQGSVDFTRTIDRLDARAIRARRRVLIIGILLFVSVLLLFTFLTRGILETREAMDIMEMDIMELNFGDRQGSLERVLEHRAVLLADNLVKSTDDEQAEKIGKQLEDAFADLERYRKITEIGKEADAVQRSSGISSVIGSAVLSLGAVGFVILLIQIAVTFMRYHTRLAELYEAQADALRASGGIPSRAYAFMEHFSPNAIELGKAPTTLYEKALDTIREVSKK